VHTPFKTNMTWAYDFVFGSTATGRRKSTDFKCEVLIGYVNVPEESTTDD
jgi:hypothetical protein